MSRRLQPYMTDGMIKSRGDYGDCIHNMGTVHFQVMASRKYHLMTWSDYTFIDAKSWERTVHRLEVKPGQWIRHDDSNDPLAWTSNPSCISRDSIRPIIRAAAVMGDRGVIKRFAWAHLKRLWLFMPNNRRNGSTLANHGEFYDSNVKLNKWHKFILKYRIPLFGTPKGVRNYNWKLPDPTGPPFWAMLFRGLGVPFYPLFWLADIMSVISAYGTVKKSTYYIDPNGSNKGHKGDIRNSHEHLQFCKMYYNTWFNTWAMKVYSRLDPQHACDLWWSEERNEAPLNETMRPLTHYMFGKSNGN